MKISTTTSPPQRQASLTSLVLKMGLLGHQLLILSHRTGLSVDAPTKTTVRRMQVEGGLRAELPEALISSVQQLTQNRYKQEESDDAVNVHAM